MRRASVLGAALLLAACSSTSAPGAGQTAGNGNPAAKAGATAAGAASAASAPAPSAAPRSDGPVTPTMARLLIGGERYATMGDPDAPLTIVEFSDYG